MRVLVVGAGLAGLTSARRLQEQGVDVTVLEARERVGGRIWSYQFDNGTVVELGGEWIDSSQRAVRGLADDLGLGLVETRQDFLTRDLVGGDPIPDDDHTRLARWLFDAIETMEPARLEGSSVSQLLDTIPDTGPAMVVLRSRLEGTFGASLDEVAATELDAEFGLIQASNYLRIDGGNDRLAREMAAKLDVRTSCPVDSIGQTIHGVVANTRAARETADWVIVAVPLPVLRTPGFIESPEPSLSSALSLLGMGTAAKVAVATESEPPMFRRQEEDIPAWYWTGAGPDGSTRRAVTGFAGTRKGVIEFREGLEWRLRRAVPEVGLSGAPVFVDWGVDPWARGCYSVLGPGRQDLLAQLQRPSGRMVLAGEHVNGTGTIDGAIRSGIDAADLILEMS